jgi:hypothetical protein
VKKNGFFVVLKKEKMKFLDRSYVSLLLEMLPRFRERERELADIKMLFINFIINNIPFIWEAFINCNSPHFLYQDSFHLELDTKKDARFQTKDS